MDEEIQQDEQAKEIDNKVIKKNTAKEEKLYNISLVVEQWFQKHVHGVHGLDTAVYNRLHAAKEELKQILGELQ